MKIREAIENAYELKPCGYSERVFLGWLTEIDQRIVKECYETHWVPGPERPSGTLVYDEGTDQEQTLLAEDPYARGLYLYFMCMQIDLANQEMEKYQNSMTLFNTAWAEYKAYFNRKYMPKQRAQLRF